MNIIMPQNPFEELVVVGTIFVILLAVGIYFILAIRRQIKNPEKITADDLLLRFSHLYDSGFLTREEYRSIKMRLAAKLGEISELQQEKGAFDPETRKKKKKMGAPDAELLLQQILNEEKGLSVEGDLGSSTHHTSTTPTRITIKKGKQGDGNP